MKKKTSEPRERVEPGKETVDSSVLEQYEKIINGHSGYKDPGSKARSLGDAASLIERAAKGESTVEFENWYYETFTTEQLSSLVQLLKKEQEVLLNQADAIEVAENKKKKERIESEWEVHKDEYDDEQQWEGQPHTDYFGERKWIKTYGFQYGDTVVLSSDHAPDNDGTWKIAGFGYGGTSTTVLMFREEKYSEYMAASDAYHADKTKENRDLLYKFEAKKFPMELLEDATKK